MDGSGWLARAHSADGQKFLLNAVAEEVAGAPVTIIANWRALARQ